MTKSLFIFTLLFLFFWTYCKGVKDMQSRSEVTQNGVGLLWSGRELTTKWENNLGLSSCTMPRSTVVCVVAYFRRTELLPGVLERSGID